MEKSLQIDIIGLDFSTSLEMTYPIKVSKDCEDSLYMRSRKDSMKFKDLIKDKIILLDGAFGTK
ncbi:MAG: hypothetical protein K2I23_03360, partial [Clostridia bacterium]|nr:hypothetical protein [Clostridia bacterium]